MENEIRNPGAPARRGSERPQHRLELLRQSAAARLAAAASARAAVRQQRKITIDDFAKVELRVGVVKSAERIQGADKLLKLMVDIGDEVRQVLAGIALAYAPEISSAARSSSSRISRREKCAASNQTACSWQPHPVPTATRPLHLRRRHRRRFQGEMSISPSSLMTNLVIPGEVRHPEGHGSGPKDFSLLLNS